MKNWQRPISRFTDDKFVEKAFPFNFVVPDGAYLEVIFWQVLALFGELDPLIEVVAHLLGEKRDEGRSNLGVKTRVKSRLQRLLNTLK